MPTLTYSGYFGTNAGGTSNAPTSSNNLTTCYSDTWEGLPSGAIVTKVSYSFTINSDKANSGYEHRLYWISVGSYGSGGPSLYASGSYSRDQRKSATMNSASYTFTGDMKYYVSGSEGWFSDYYITVCGKGNNSSSGIASTMGDISITVTYELPQWNYGPSNISVSQNNDGTFNISWSPASWQGSGSVYYYVYSDPSDEREWLVSTTSTGQNNVVIPVYGNVTIYVYGRQYDTNTNNFSSTASKSITFFAPSLNAPTISLSATKGQSVTITRGDSTVNKGSATSITYDLYQGSSYVGTFSGKTYSINQATLEDLKQTTITFKVRATASGVKPVVNEQSELFADSDVVIFTFEPYKTILYYTGNGSINGYEECIVYYYTGNPNEGNNGWVECEPYIYTGESNATINGWQLCSYT